MQTLDPNNRWHFLNFYMNKKYQKIKKNYNLDLHSKEQK